MAIYGDGKHNENMEHIAKKKTLRNKINMKKMYLVMESYHGCCYLSSRPSCVFTDKEAAELYVKEMNETEESKKFIENFSWEDVDCKFYLKEIECKQ